MVDRAKRNLNVAVQLDLSICSGMQEVRRSVITPAPASHGLSLANKRAETSVVANGKLPLTPLESVPVAGKAQRLSEGKREQLWQ